MALIDNSDATSGSPALAGADGQALTTPDGTPLTGAALDSGTMAIAGADVSTRGGQTALSVGTVDLSTSVTPVNDPPTMAPGHYTLPDVTSNSAESTNTGATVASLYGDAAQDGADAQQGAADPTGSTADHLAGVAITGNAANPRPRAHGGIQPMVAGHGRTCLLMSRAAMPWCWAIRPHCVLTLCRTLPARLAA
ncbi:hypothetical protein RAA17_10480 [Komagataeibacter rhaeticus]|nr:hypothetical protein [Komagataeibacter rhaeticus]